MTFGPEMADPLELAWLAGLLEGEGSFLRGPPSSRRLPAIRVAMNDRDVLERVASLWGSRLATIAPRRDGWAVSYSLNIRGANAVAWMHALRPLMGTRRQAQIDRAVASYAPPPHRVMDDAGAQLALDRLRDGWSVRRVAEAAGTTVWTVYDLRLGRSYRHLDPPPELRAAQLGARQRAA